MGVRDQRYSSPSLSLEDIFRRKQVHHCDGHSKPIWLLFWKLVSDTLVECGFVLSPYDQCVENKVINGKQCTIICLVDDLKISHADKV